MRDDLQRIINLLEPEYSNITNSLKDEEKDYFIEHMTMSIYRGLKEWKYIINKI